MHDSATVRTPVPAKHPDDAIEASNSRISQAFVDRGNIWFAGGNYYEAIRDYASALNIDTRNKEAHDRHAHAQGCLKAYFTSEGDAERLRQDFCEQGQAEYYRNIIRKAILQQGYLVTANSLIILARLPLSHRGRHTAIDYANLLARDPGLRSMFANDYWVASDDCTVVVYEQQSMPKQVLCLPPLGEIP